MINPALDSCDLIVLGIARVKMYVLVMPVPVVTVQMHSSRL